MKTDRNHIDPTGFGLSVTRVFIPASPFGARVTSGHEPSTEPVAQVIDNDGRLISALEIAAERAFKELVSPKPLLQTVWLPGADRPRPQPPKVARKSMVELYLARIGAVK